MLTYCYRTKDGDIHELNFPMGEAPAFVWIATKTKRLFSNIAWRDYGAEGVTGTVVGTANPTRANQRPKRSWPMACVGSGVHASQAGDLRKHLAERGCPTEVTKDGDPVYTSAAHRRKALKIRGFHDKASFC